MGAFGRIDIAGTLRDQIGGGPTGANKGAQNFAAAGNGYATPGNSQASSQQQNPYVTQPVRQGELIGAPPAGQPQQSAQMSAPPRNPYFGNPQATGQLQQGAYGRNMYAPNVQLPAGNGRPVQTFGTYGMNQPAGPSMRGVAVEPGTQRQLPADTVYHAAPNVRPGGR